jgi:hypothetical protein
MPKEELDKWCHVRAEEAFYFSECAICSIPQWDVNGHRVTREYAEAHIIYMANLLISVRSGVF